MPTTLFHRITSQWFKRRFGMPTEPQRLGWPAIASGRHTLIAAPTGSGKTLAAFLSSIDCLLRQGFDGTLTPQTQVVYVSPLKALSNDVQRNLDRPLAEIVALASEAGFDAPPIRAQVRTGDTPASQRQAMVRRPPHILVTTPESLYLLLTAPKGRETLRTVRTVIVDEIHALARDKRGSHLTLSLERLSALCSASGGEPPVRIGLSATQRPIDEIARFLVGALHVGPNGDCDCQFLDVGHARDLDLNVEVPPGELSAVCSHETWKDIYARLEELINTHRSTLIFVNTRRMAERVSHYLTETLGEDSVASHHGSLSRELRLSSEERLKRGELKAIVATASLELGIDIGFVDLVCQIGSPRSIATLLQRVGRSGHSLGLIPKGRIFALTRDELIECLAMLRAARRGTLDAVEIPPRPLDILAQQMVAEVACEPIDEEALFERFRRAWPYHDLRRDEFDAVVHMLSEGIFAGNRQGAYLHRDRVNNLLKPRRNARISAVTSGGAIPETADYRVVTADERTFVGTVDEDFAIESLAGDVFLLGNTSWRVRYVRGGEVVVDDAKGLPPSIPFWFGEAPGRTIELSEEISELRDEAAKLPTESAACGWLQSACGVDTWPAQQAAAYVHAQKAAISVMPTSRCIVFERFFDESGGMQLVIHAPLGARINRAWGLALRKRFCRTFNFELQAAATDNGILLSLGPQHSFPIDRMFTLIGSKNAELLLEQAMLAAPMFPVRWRWNVTRALAVLRRKGGKKVPPYLQRYRSDDLLAAVFPNQVACLENIVGDIEIPDHPLVRQTVLDCKHEAMDVNRWLDLIQGFEAGRIEFSGCDTREPSPFSHEILNANPYAFLDDAPLEERRVRAVSVRRTLDAESLRDLSHLNPAAIEQVRRDAWPTVRDADELHDALMLLGALPAAEGQPWKVWFGDLMRDRRATTLTLEDGNELWIATERWPLVSSLYPDALPNPPVQLPLELQGSFEAHEAVMLITRGRLESVGPTTAKAVSNEMGLRLPAVEAALEALEAQGVVLRGRFTAVSTTDVENARDDAPAVQWCERRLLARIHRLTLEASRREIEPVTPTDYMRFLSEFHRLNDSDRRDGSGGVLDAIGQLQGFEIPAGAWESEVLPARIKNYERFWLDSLATAGAVIWGRLQPPRRGEDAVPSNAPLTRVVPISLALRSDVAWLLPPDRISAVGLMRGNARLVYETLVSQGALFVQDLLAATELLPGHLDDALSELAALGLVTADAFAPIRALVARDRLGSVRRHARSNRKEQAVQRGGRWSRFPPNAVETSDAERHERWARLLLRRYGVMFRDLLCRENVAPAWRDLVVKFRRLEARGEIRGGRFVSGVAGEQYASPEAVEQLRRVRGQPPSGDWLVLSAADPLNLYGVLDSSPRVPATNSNAIVVRDGRLLASRRRGRIEIHQRIEPEIARDIRCALTVDSAHRRRASTASSPETATT